jgi:hypothetical protein
MVSWVKSFVERGSGYAPVMNLLHFSAGFGKASPRAQTIELGLQLKSFIFFAVLFFSIEQHVLDTNPGKQQSSGPQMSD